VSEVKVGDRFLRLYRFIECEVEYEVRAIDGDTAWISTRDTDGDLSYDSVPVFRLLHSGGFRRIEPFFEVGKTYRWPGSFDQWTVHSIAEHNGSKAAVVYRETDHTTAWGVFRHFPHFEEVND